MTTNILVKKSEQVKLLFSCQVFDICVKEVVIVFQVEIHQKKKKKKHLVTSLVISPLQRKPAAFTNCYQPNTKKKREEIRQ